MAHTKVSDVDLRAYLESGHSQAEAARYFGVSEPYGVCQDPHDVGCRRCSGWTRVARSAA
jgi:hypothetical protein